MDHSGNNGRGMSRRDFLQSTGVATHTLYLRMSRKSSRITGVLLARRLEVGAVHRRRAVVCGPRFPRSVVFRCCR